MLKPQKSQPTNKKSFQAITKIFKWSHLNLSWFPFPKIIEDCKTLWSKYKLTKKNLWEIPNYPSNPSFYGKIRNFFLFRSFADLQGKRKLFIGLKKALISNKFAIWRKDQTETFLGTLFSSLLFTFECWLTNFEILIRILFGQWPMATFKYNPTLQFDESLKISRK